VFAVVVSMLWLGRGVLIGAEPANPAPTAPAAGGAAPAVQPPPAFDASRLVPLPQAGSYHGFRGGLYPEGMNEPPLEHRLAGMERARQIQPLGLAGTPEAGGKIVLLSVGMSNTTQEFQAFQRLAAADSEINPAVVPLDGAQGGMTAAAIRNPEDNGTGARYWETVDTRLQQAGLSRAQVQAVWLKEANARPAEPFPKHAQILQGHLAEIAHVLQRRFPRLQVVYLSSRIYGGYAKTPLNPEPYAYESGFAVKWLIEDQIRNRDSLNFVQAYGPLEAPWLAWGPYLWANGAKARADGLTWLPEDFGPDGTHPSPQGREKVARLLLDFLKKEPTARVWFVRGGK
jgi:hypothetical protein